MLSAHRHTERSKSSFETFSIVFREAVRRTFFPIAKRISPSPIQTHTPEYTSRHLEMLVLRNKRTLD